MNISLLLTSTLRYAAPILLAAVGALFCDSAGVTFIILEAEILLAAFFSVIGSYFFGSWVLGVLCGVTASLLLAFFFYWITVKGGAHEMVVGFSINALIGGLTIYLLRVIFGQSGSFVSNEIVKIPYLKIPLLSRIPVIGSMFAGHSWIVYFSLLSVLFVAITLYRTSYGLKIISCGRNPLAASTVGINVYRVRLSCIIIASILCGLAGAQLSIGFLSLFSEGMTVGKGFIALGAVMFAQGKPGKLLFIVLLFGIAEGIGNQIQISGLLPSDIVLMIPYLAVLACVFFRKRVVERY